MKRITFFLAALLMFSGLSVAQQRSAEEAAALAAQFVNGRPALRKAHRAPQTADMMRLSHTRKKASQDENAFYVFNRADNAGFIVVSADERTAEDVLFYSEKGEFNMETVNPNLRWWLERFEKEISSIPADEPVTNRAPQAVQEVTPIAPLLTDKNGKEITWYQTEPYNNLCPIDRMDNTRSYTGCVATAAAQVMFHWRWPAKGSGISQYTWQNCLELNNYTGRCTNSKDTVLKANYSGTTYDWDNMTASYCNISYNWKGEMVCTVRAGITQAQKDAVATLMYQCGVASEMEYGGDAYGGSGTLTDYMAYGLQKYFNYKFTKMITMYSQYEYGSAKGNIPIEYSVNRNKFTSYFNADLEAGRPIIMGGGSDSYGHEFVCCGRDKDNKFYINWGWEGEGNGYTAISALRPEGDSSGFSQGLDAIIGLEPNIPEGVEEVPNNKVQSTKVLRNGQVLIQRGDATYTIFGQKIN